jgi:hypothetical protein
VELTHFMGVDFSGAKLAGRNTWIAHTIAQRVGRRERLRLVDVAPLERLCGVAEREPALALLVEMIRGSTGAVWGIDFPFGLPVELFAPEFAWRDQLDLTADWRRGAYAMGLWCVKRSQKVGRRMHIRRVTDVDAKAPFDCYHYRIVYQTFHGMRDVLAPLADAPRTAVLPFQYRKLRSAERVLVESCPSSTLKRLGLPHQNYKSPTTRLVSRKHRRTRDSILAGLAPDVEIAASQRREVLSNPGGDALDAVIAAVGAWQQFRAADHAAIRRHPRYPREGFIYG